MIAAEKPAWKGVCGCPNVWYANNGRLMSVLHFAVTGTGWLLHEESIRKRGKKGPDS
jgi:hypothetical protein